MAKKETKRNETYYLKKVLYSHKYEKKREYIELKHLISNFSIWYEFSKLQIVMKDFLPTNYIQ